MAKINSRITNVNSPIIWFQKHRFSSKQVFFFIARPWKAQDRGLGIYRFLFKFTEIYIQDQVSPSTLCLCHIASRATLRPPARLSGEIVLFPFNECNLASLLSLFKLLINEAHCRPALRVLFTLVKPNRNSHLHNPSPICTWLNI